MAVLATGHAMHLSGSGATQNQASAGGTITLRHDGLARQQRRVAEIVGLGLARGKRTAGARQAWAAATTSARASCQGWKIFIDAARACSGPAGKREATACVSGLKPRPDSPQPRRNAVGPGAVNEAEFIAAHGGLQNDH